MNPSIEEVERERDDLRYRLRQRDQETESDIRRMMLQQEIVTMKRLLGDLPLVLK